MRSYDTKRLGPGNFWVGAAALAFFSVVSLVAGYWAVEATYLEWILDREGVSTNGIVLDKTYRDWDDPPFRDYHVIYSFEVDSKKFTKRVAVDSYLWQEVKVGGPISVVYMPGHPELNLPEPIGSRLSASSLFVTAVPVTLGTLFIVILLLMINRKRKGHYSADKWFVTTRDLAKKKQSRGIERN